MAKDATFSQSTIYCPAMVHVKPGVADGSSGRRRYRHQDHVEEARNGRTSATLKGTIANHYIDPRCRKPITSRIGYEKAESCNGA